MQAAGRRHRGSSGLRLSRLPCRALELPEASPQFGILGFNGPSGGGFPLSTGFGLSPSGGFLLGSDGGIGDIERCFGGRTPKLRQSQAGTHWHQFPSMAVARSFPERCAIRSHQHREAGGDDRAGSCEDHPRASSLAIALSVAMLLGVEKVRRRARARSRTRSLAPISSSGRAAARFSSCSTRSSASATPPATSPGRATGTSRVSPGFGGRCRSRSETRTAAFG